MTESPIQNFNYGYTDTGLRFIKSKDLKTIYETKRIYQRIRKYLKRRQ